MRRRSPALLSASLAASLATSFVAATPAVARRPTTPAPFFAPIAADARHGAPALVQFNDPVPPSSTTPETAARELLRRHADALPFSPRVVDKIVDTLLVDGVFDTGRGPIVVRFRHVHGDLEVWHDALKVVLARDTLALRAVSGQLHDALPASPRFAQGADDAIAEALSRFGDKGVDARDVVLADDVDGAGYRAASVGARDDLVVDHLRVKPVLAPVGVLVVPAFVVELGAQTSLLGRVARSIVVDARDGNVVADVDLRHDAAFTYRVWADEQGRPLDGPYGDTTPYAGDAPDGHVPALVAPTLVTMDGFNGPHDPWIDVDATETTGNNVDAYTDDANPDGFSAGDIRGTTTAPGVFDHTYDPTRGPQDDDEQRMASATGLFYVVNWLHDWWYDAGFTEAARNAQTDNYGRGGTGGDAIQALAQYAAPQARDNSAMEVNDEGASPRMDMFVWSGKGHAGIEFDGDELVVDAADFGPRDFSLTAEAAALVDGTAPTDDACEPATNDLTGKIAVLARGTCTFTQKVRAAEQAGAVGVVVVDNVDGEPPPPLSGDGSEPAITIPSLSLTLADGDALRAAIAAGPVTLTLTRVFAPDVDGAFDIAVAAHEWGHYLHLRQIDCEAAQCSAHSEGIGDFIALHTMVRDGDDLDGTFAVGSFATQAFIDDPAYFGIRRYPYSADAQKNPLTFRHIADSASLPEGPGSPPLATSLLAPNSESHAAGEVFSQMLFQGYVALLRRSQGDAPAYSFDDARRRMSDAFEAGLQIAPPSPTTTEMRDAILAGATGDDADNGNDGDVTALATAYASRGVGTCAQSPARDSEDFEGVVEDFDVGSNVAITSVALRADVASCDDDGILDAGETGHVDVIVQNASPSPVDGATVTLSSSTPGLTFANATLTVGPLAPYATTTVGSDVVLAVAAAALEPGAVTARVTSGPTCATDGITIGALLNGDDVATGLSTDTVESANTAWAFAGEFAEYIWARVETPPEDGVDVDAGNHAWAGFDAPLPSDTALVSPALHVADDADFVVRFRHRHSFESDGTSNYDGGVIEFSDDDGVSWSDLSTVADVPYEGVIGDVQSQAHNSLKGRQGFVGDNASLPDFDDVVIDAGRALAGRTVLLRFRIATDEGQGGPGWEFDDLAVDGITNAPFSGLVDNVVRCEGVPGEGEGEGEGEGDHIAELTLGGGGCAGCASDGRAGRVVDVTPGAALVALAVIGRARRRRR